MTVPPRRFHLGFSSLGKPEATLRELFDMATTHGMEFVELRALEGTTALPDYLTPERIAAAREPGSLPIRLVASNLQLLNAEDDDIESFCRYAAVADALGAPFVRVFGGGHWEKPVSDRDVERAAAAAMRCREELHRRGIRAEMLMETHFGFSSSADCARINEMLPSPLLILWDSHHTWRRHGETPAETWSRIAPWVRHIHYKDSRMEGQAAGDGLHVPPGEGEYPVRDLKELLEREGYAGGVSLEWEKLWHRDLPEISAALPLFRSCFEQDKEVHIDVCEPF